MKHSKSLCPCADVARDRADPELLPGVSEHNLEVEQDRCAKAVAFALNFVMLGWERLLTDTINELGGRGCYKLVAWEKRPGITGGFSRCGEPVLAGRDVCGEHAKEVKDPRADPTAPVVRLPPSEDRDPD